MNFSAFFELLKKKYFYFALFVGASIGVSIFFLANFGFAGGPQKYKEGHFMMGEIKTSRIDILDATRDEFFYTSSTLPNAKIYSEGDKELTATVCRIPENTESIWQKTHLSGINLSSDDDVNRWIQHSHDYYVNTSDDEMDKYFISLLQEKKIINTPFEKERENLNRAEFLKIVLEAKKQKEAINISGYKNCFNDVQEQWFAPYVCYAKDKGYIEGYSKTEFKPEKNINYAEAIKIVYNVFNDPGKTNPNKNEWWSSYDEDFKEKTGGLENSRTKPDHTIQRVQMVEMIVKYFNAKYPDVFQKDILSTAKADQARKELRQNMVLKSSIGPGDCSEKKTYTFTFSGEKNQSQDLILSEKIKEFSQPFGVFALYLNDDQDLNSTARYFGVMNVGILQKSSNTTQFIWAFDIDTGNPIPNLTIRNKTFKLKQIDTNKAFAKSDYFQSVLAGRGIFKGKENVMNYLSNAETEVLGTTNQDGILQIESEMENRYNFFIASNNSHWGVHYNRWQESMNHKKFPNAWEKMENQQVVGIIYPDRKMFRPGHTINFKGFLKHLDSPEKMGLKNLPPKTPVTIHLRKGSYNGESVQSTDVVTSNTSSFDGEIIIKDNVNLGDYYISIELPEKYSTNNYLLSAPIKIEEYKRPTFFVEVEPEKHEYFSGETAIIDIFSARYFGDTIKNRPVEYKIYSKPYYPTDTQTPEYKSINDECEYFCYYKLHQIDSGNITLNESGHAAIQLPVFDLQSQNANNEVQNQTIIVEAKVKDDKGEEITSKASFIAFLDKSAEDSVRPALKIQSSIAEENKSFPIEVRSKNFMLKNTPHKTLSLSIYKEDQKCQLLNDITRGERKNCSSSQNEIFSGEIKTDANGYGSYNHYFNEAGLYSLTLSGTGEHRVYQDIWVIPASQSRGKDTDEQTNHDLSLFLDKDTYKVGEKAKLFIYSPFPESKALISFESDRVFDSKIIDITGNYFVHEFVVTQGMQPNINVGVFLVEKIDKNDKNARKNPPRFKLGYKNLLMSLADKKMQVGLTVDNSMKNQKNPEKTYEIHEKIRLTIDTKDFEKKGVASEVSVAVVDESLVRMAGQVETNFLYSFFPKRYLTIENSTNLLAFLHDNYFSSFGGAGKGGRGSGIPPIREDFREVLYWNPSVMVPSSGKISISFDSGEMPTSYVILVAGVSTDGKNKAGFAEEIITVKKDFLVQPDAPRFLRKGDKAEIPFIVFNNSAITQNVTLQMQSTGVTNLSDAQTVNIPPRTSKRVSFNIEVPENTTEEFATFTAITKGVGSDNDAVKVTLPILSNQSSMHSFQNYQLTSSGEIILPNFFLEKNVSLEGITLNVSNSSLIDLKNKARKLIRYPYGCAEQTTSSTLPNAIVAAIQKTIGEDSTEAEKNTKAGLKRLENFQRSDGGFSLWEGGDESDVWVSLIVGNGLAEMESVGYSITKQTRADFVAYLKKKVAGKDEERLSRIRLLAVLAALEPTEAVKYTDGYYEEWANLSGLEKVDLAFAIAKIAENSPEKYNSAFLQTLEKDIAQYDTYKEATAAFDEGSYQYYAFKHLKQSYKPYYFTVRLTLNKNFEGRDEMIRSLVNASDVNYHYYSSLSEARKFLASYHYSKVTEKQNTGSVAIQLGNSKKSLSFAQNNTVKTVSFSKAEVSNLQRNTLNQADINLAQEGNIYISADFELKKPLEQLLQQHPDLYLKRTFEWFNEETQNWEAFDENTQNMKIGEKYQITLHHKNSSDIEDIAISSFHPAGIELITDYSKTGQEKSGYNYQNIERRDDRVDVFPYNLDNHEATFYYSYEIRPVASGTYSFPPATMVGMYDAAYYSSTAGFMLTVEE
jgi:uncharacterized protein YfaS (alpha-2-macroglobulin family)